MSDEKKYTERDVVMRERYAYAKGYRDGANNWTEGAYARSEVAAHRLYPLPNVTRARVVIMQDQAWSAREWMYSGGNLMSRLVSNYPAPWSHAAQITPTAENIKALADLLANPTEEVDADV